MRHWEYSAANVKLTHDFRAKVGSLMYLSCGTRPDIAQAVNVCSRKMSAPTENDMKRVDRIIRYINAHPAHGIFYGQMDNLEFSAYVDSDTSEWHEVLHASRLDDRGKCRGER